MKNRTFRNLWIGSCCVFAIAATGYVLDAADHNDYKEKHRDHQMHETHQPGMQGKTVRVANGESLEIRSAGADLSYDVTEIRAKAGDEITIRYVNASDMPHNIILVNEEGDINPVGIAALQAYDNDYVPEAEMERIIVYTKLARPGETVELTVTVPPPGTYPYICTYPGHFTLMQGRLISTE